MKTFWGIKILSNNGYFAAALRKLLVATILGLALPAGAWANVQLLDRVVAVVDDDVVLASEVDEQVKQILHGMKKAGKPAPPMDELRRQVLDKLILENIQLQMAHRAGVRINDTQLNEAMTRIAKQNGLDLVQFKAALEADGLSYTETREQIRKEMLINRVQQGSVNSRVQITDQEIDNFLNSEEGKSVTAPEYRMLHTLVPVSAEASQADIAKARAYAGKLYKKIAAGGDYRTVLSGKQPYKLVTTDLGWRKADDLPSLLTSLTGSLQKGQTAPPIQSASGFHLVKLEDTRGKGEIIRQTHARHILLKPSAIRDDEATHKLIESLRQRILKGEDFGELARKYSEDIGSAQEGGDLGWTSPGQLVEAFQKAMDNTPINAISQPFHSPYGWHIVQVLERRQKDVTEQVRRNIAHNYLYKRKYDDELQAWLQKIRDEAYVDYK